MADTTFVNGTAVLPEWLNDINDNIYDGNAAPAGTFRNTLANAVDADKGDALVGVRSSKSNSVATTQHEINGRYVNVFDFFSDAQRADVLARTGAVDVTTAVQNAISALGSNPGTVHFPAGVYRITSQLTVSTNRVHLVGDGSWATQFLFIPTANSSCVYLSAGAAVLYQGSVKGISFYSTDSTYTKTAIEVVDTSGYVLDDIVVGGSVVSGGSTFWSGGTGSIGIKYRGREFCVTKSVFCYADKPLVVSENPNFSIDIDHFHFMDLYLGANSNPCVTIDTGINLTNVTFDGAQVWVLGTTGLQWVDTTSAGVSQTLVLKNIRWEQGSSSSAWCVDIQHNSTLQSLLIENCQGGFERNGYRLRNCQYVSIKNNINTATSGSRTALDVTSSVRHLTLENCLWGAGSVASMTGQRVLWSYPKLASGAPLPPTAVYDSTSNSARQIITEGALQGYEITLANAATAALGTNTMGGRLVVVDSEYFTGSFDIKGTSNAVSEAPADTTGVYSTAAGTATSTNVYWSGANSQYEIQNLRGAARRYKIFFVGTYTSF